MNIESLRTVCLSLPGTSEDVKWGSDLCFLVGGKIFAITGVSSNDEFGCALKCDPEIFARLTERDGIVPSPYLARYYWISIRRADALSMKEWNDLIGTSYQLVYDKLPAKVKKTIAAETHR
jgi:predicted DNA-binding protein (MmcQ/YjbR family)